MTHLRRSLLNKVRPLVEFLEDRLTPSWGSTPPATITPPTSFTSVTLNTSGDATGNASITSNENDFYRFTAATAGSYIFEATTPSSNLDTVIATYTSTGSRVGFNDDISSSNRDSRFTVTLSAGATYFFGVTNYTGTAGGSYTWRIDGPAASTDDAYENNDTLATAYNLGTLTSNQNYTGLKLADAADYYKFTMNGSGTSSNSVSISFTHSMGDIDMRLYNSSGTQVGSSGGTGNSETISLNGMAAGTYTIQVFGYNGVLNAGGYSMSISPGTGSGGGGGNRTLYFNFDGANISRSNLVSWAGSHWNPNDLDADQNGITVSAFLSSRSDRETIINQIIAYVQADLNPYGITVQRTTGLAVTGVGATTVFWGPATLSGGAVHIACDIDQGNNNPTDIAFVGNEDWGSAADTALAMADVGLHEAGHTFGLWHVASGTNPESMGLRYNTPQSQWLQNTYFMNQTFNAYVSGGFAHGPGPQNAHQTMVNNFGSGSNPPGGGGGGSTGNLAMNPDELAHHLANCTPVAHQHEDDHDHDHDFSFGDDASEKLAVALLNPEPVSPEPVAPVVVKPTSRVAGRDFDAWRTEVMAQVRGTQAVAPAMTAAVKQLRSPANSMTGIAPAARQSFESWQNTMLNKVRKATSNAAFASVDAGGLSLNTRVDRLQALLG